MKLLVLILGLLSLGSNAQARPVGFEVFPEVMDYDAFEKLDREDQREYVRLLMQTMVDFEEGWIQASKLPPTPENKQLQKTTWEDFQKFQQALKLVLGNITISDAFARTTVRRLQGPVSQGRCVIGGWDSTFVRVPNSTKLVCQRPAASINPAQSRCPAGQMACNSAVFGTQDLTATGHPFCVEINVINDHNASLACLIAFEGQTAPTMDERLNAMVDRILSNREASTSFNNTAQMITNTCICGQDATATGQTVTMNRDYVNYMQNHRTCYALMGLMRYYAQKIQSKTASAGICTLISPTNAGDFATALASLDHYTDRVTTTGRLRQGNESYVATLHRYRTKYATDSASVNNGKVTANNNTTVADSANDLDFVANIDSGISNLRTATVTRSDGSTAPRWCPIYIAPNIAPPPPASCTIENVVATAGGTVTGTITPAPASGARVVWKINGGDDITASGAALSGPIPTGVAANSPIQLTATVTPASGAAISCNGSGTVTPGRTLAGGGGGGDGAVDCNATPRPASCGPARVDCNATPRPASCGPAPVDCNATPRPASCGPAPVDCNATPRPASCGPAPVDCNATPRPASCGAAAVVDCNATPRPASCGAPLDGSKCEFELTASRVSDTQVKFTSTLTLTPQDLSTNFAWSFAVPAPRNATGGTGAPPANASTAPVTSSERNLRDWTVQVPSGTTPEQAKSYVTLAISNCKNNTACPSCGPKPPTITPPPASTSNDYACTWEFQDNGSNSYTISFNSPNITNYRNQIDSIEWGDPIPEDQKDARNPTVTLPTGKTTINLTLHLKNNGGDKTCTTDYTVAPPAFQPVVAPTAGAQRISKPVSNGARFIQGLK